MSEFDIDRKHYSYFNTLSTRWIDNDVYGHINNTVYYTWFDTVANAYLIETGVLDIEHSAIVGFIVASSCQYRSPIRFPTNIEAALRVNRIGNKSVEYGIAIFRENESEAAAYGTFTHVFVERQSGQSVSIPENTRQVLEAILISHDQQ